MNGPLFARTLAWQRVRWLIIGLAIFGWGILIPLFYAAFSDAVRDLARSGAIPEELLNFGSGSLLTLPDAITLGTQHPLAIAMLGVFAVGATSTAIAGERQRGTLEVLLARPIGRTTTYLTVLIALLLVVATVLGALLAGFVAGVLVGRRRLGRRTSSMFRIELSRNGEADVLGYTAIPAMSDPTFAHHLARLRCEGVRGALVLIEPVSDAIVALCPIQQEEAKPAIPADRQDPRWTAVRRPSQTIGLDQ